MQNVLITIVIPTYHRLNYLKLAIDSALNQENANCNYEVIVLDNELKPCVEMDRLIESYSDSKLTYIRNTENLGMIGNWNKGFAVGSGEWIAMLHDDDCLDRNYIERMAHYINNLKDASCIIPNHREIDANGGILKNSKKNKRINKLILKLRKDKFTLCSELDDKILGFNHYGCPSCGMIVKREDALSIGGYSTEYIGISDWDFYLNLRENCRVYKLNEVLASYRLAVNSNDIIGYTERTMREREDCLLRHYSKIKFKYQVCKKAMTNLTIGYNEWEFYWTMSKKKKLPKFKYVVIALIRRMYMYFRELYI